MTKLDLPVRKRDTRTAKQKSRMSVYLINILYIYIYQFQALPFGLNMAHRVFTKLLKPVAAFLRK